MFRGLIGEVTLLAGQPASLPPIDNESCRLPKNAQDGAVARRGLVAARPRRSPAKVAGQGEVGLTETGRHDPPVGLDVHPQGLIE